MMQWFLAANGSRLSGSTLVKDQIPLRALSASSACHAACRAGAQAYATKPRQRILWWQRLERGKQPYFVRMRDERLFAFAGLWDRWESPDKGVIETCTILTTAANAVLAPIHDRMPVILPTTVYDQWLDPALLNTDLLAPLLVPFPPEE